MSCHHNKQDITLGLSPLPVNEYLVLRKRFKLNHNLKTIQSKQIEDKSHKNTNIQTHRQIQNGGNCTT